MSFRCPCFLTWSLIALVLLFGTAAAQAPGYEQYQYDSLGRLILRWDNTGRQEGFTFDAAENRSQASVATGATPPAPVPPASPMPPSFLLLRTPQRTVVLPWPGSP